jgi:hypothetical protein
MTFNPNALLTVEELVTPRTPAELACWVEEKNRLFADCPEAREWVLLRQGLANRFYNEVYPLSCFVTHRYAGRSDIQCIPNLDNRDFDARILDFSISPPSELKVEITSATEDYSEYLRWKYFVQHRSVNAVGEVSVTGTKHRGHKIHVEDEVFAHTDVVDRICSFIQSAIERKSVRPNAPQKYSQGHVLLVAFDEWYVVRSAQDIATIQDCVERHIRILPLNFAALYVVGLLGKTYIHFALPRRT